MIRAGLEARDWDGTIRYGTPGLALSVLKLDLDHENSSDQHASCPPTKSEFSDPINLKKKKIFVKKGLNAGFYSDFSKPKMFSCQQAIYHHFLIKHKKVLFSSVPTKLNLNNNKIYCFQRCDHNSFSPWNNAFLLKNEIHTHNGPRTQRRLYSVNKSWHHNQQKHGLFKSHLKRSNPYVCW